MKSETTETREVEKPNVIGKLWSQQTKRESTSQSMFSIGDYHETKQLNTINKIVLQTLERKLGILRLHFNEPTITGTEKLKLNTCCFYQP